MKNIVNKYKYKNRLSSALLIMSILLTLNLSGCSEIDYPEADEFLNSIQDYTDTGSLVSDTTESAESADSTETTETSQIKSPYNESKLLDYNISRQEFSAKTQMEKIEGHTAYTLLNGYEGGGYIQLSEGMTATWNADITISQHYRVGICICSTGGIVSLTIDGIDHGAYYITDAEDFKQFYLNYIYLRSGVNKIEFKVIKGIIYFDYALITDIGTLPKERYTVSSIPINKTADDRTIDVMRYLTETFGNRVLTGQHCTINSNAEINAIYAVTGRYPAIRCGDLANYSRKYNDSDKSKNYELELAEEWAKKGGLISFNWSWYAPVSDGDKSHYFSSETDFDLDKAYTPMDISMYELNQIEAYYEGNAISASCLEIIKDIDDMAENLKRLRDQGITVLWRPLMQAGIKWYWWGDCEPRSYIWLWKLMVDRMNNFHGLSNLIWVWNGEDYDYYPGDEYVDIIGEDIYNMGDTSNVARFASTTRYGSRRKAAAMTECGLVPNPDVLFRDNARWLWFSLYRGDYLVEDSGFYRGGINTKERLTHAYNHEKTITLDELRIKNINS